MDKKKAYYIQDDVLKHIEQDTFGHKHIASSITQSIINTSPPFIIGIFGGWGTGKSSLMEIVKSTLPVDDIETVWIDAWRYTSAKNLQRSFLIHVANKKAKGLLKTLRRKLYTSEQETLPAESSLLDDIKEISFGQILKLILTFVFYWSVFIIPLFILLTIQSLLLIEDFKVFNESTEKRSII